MKSLIKRIQTLFVACLLVTTVCRADVHEVASSTEFAQAIAQGKVVVEFGAAWCGACRMYGPTFKQVSDELSGYKFLKVDVDQLRDIAGAYNVGGIPMTIFFKEGQPVGQPLVGAVNGETLKSKISSMLGE